MLPVPMECWDARINTWPVRDRIDSVAPPTLHLLIFFPYNPISTCAFEPLWPGSLEIPKHEGPGILQDFCVRLVGKEWAVFPKAHC